MVEGGELRRAGDRAGRERGGDGVGPARSRGAAGPAPSTRGGTSPGCCSTDAQRGHRRPSPHSHTRPRSLRTRSTIITFSARSLARKPSGSAAVPLIGDDSTTRAVAPQEPLGRRRRHVHAVRGQAHDRGVRRGVALGQRRARARRRRRPRGSGADSRRVRFTWYTSPAAIAAADGRARPRMNASRSRLDVHAPAADPCHGRPGHGTAGRTSAKRAQTGCAVEGQHDRPEARDRRARRGRGDVDQAGAEPPADAPRARGVRHEPTITRRSARTVPDTVDFELTDEQEAFRKVVRDFARREIAPHAEAWDRDHTFPVDTVLRHGRARPVRPAVPRGVRRRRRRPHHAVRRHRGAGPGRPLDGDHARSRRRARRQPDLPVRHRGAEATLAARPVRRARPRRVRAHRARRRQRRRRHAHEGGARRRRRPSG